MAKKKSAAKLKKELDKWFSLYIRWYYADDTGYVECYTCGVQKPVKEMQCGHFQSRRHHATRFDENNCRPQCVKCNMFSQGEQYLFGERLKSDLGEDAVDDLIRLTKSTMKWSVTEYEEAIQTYKKLVKEMIG
mgnify:FL=1